MGALIALTTVLLTRTCHDFSLLKVLLSRSALFQTRPRLGFSASLPFLAGTTARFDFQLRLALPSASLLFQELLVSQLLLVFLSAAGRFGVSSLMVSRVWLRRYVPCHGNSPP
jgi:hypothetical protein